jgi:threonine dehydrogenase-like Zn-dependent dehydrogenase
LRAARYHGRGDVALVGGAGPIGLLLAALLTATGLTVVVTEASAARKAMAEGPRWARRPRRSRSG